MAGRLQNWWKGVLGRRPAPQVQTKRPASNAYSGTYTPYYTHIFNGEKNLGEIGPPRNYLLDYDTLRVRSWQSFLESEITQTVMKRYVRWKIGAGLKLHSEPAKVLLQAENIPLDAEEFNEAIESRWQVWAKSTHSVYDGMSNLNQLAQEADKNATIGGDVLVVLRVVNGMPKVQLIDGAHVRYPMGSSFIETAAANGNKIINGIEMNATGGHVAYYVCTGPTMLTYKRIEAKGPTGLRMAYLVYGLKFRLDNHRGIPLISVVMETLKKMERYKEATIGSAEERQKIAYSIEHEEFSTGENPMTSILRKSVNTEATDDVPVDDEGNRLADRVIATTNKQAFNMPNGTHLKILESKNELYFKDFFTVNIDVVCAAIEIPPNVAMMKYDSNYSASRAAIKDWEHTLNVNRINFSQDFYQPIYELFLETQVLIGKVLAPGYLKAILEGNLLVVAAYRNARFIGPSVPHIDPMKEVQAERMKLGGSAANIPLTTVEKATENVNGGDSDANMEQFAEELEEAKELNIVAPEPEEKPAPATDPED